MATENDIDKGIIALGEAYNNARTEEEATAIKNEMLTLANEKKELQKASEPGSRWKPMGDVILGAGRSAVDQIAKPFNSGVFESVAFPSRLINAGVNLASAGFSPTTPTPAQMGREIIPVEGPRAMLAETGLLARRGEEATGILPRSMEILGASVGPAATIGQIGVKTLAPTTNMLSTSVKGNPAYTEAIPGFAKVEGSGLAQVGGKTRLTPEAYKAELAALPETLAARTAATPVLSAATDVGSSIGAGWMGESVSQLTDDPNLILLGELGGGFVFPVVSAVSRFGRGGNLTNNVKSPFRSLTEEGSGYVVSDRFKALAREPTIAASEIDVNSPVSPGRQTGREGLIKLEKLVLAENPKIAERYTKELQENMMKLQEQATQFGGENRTREILKSGQDYLLELVKVRAQQAAQQAQMAIMDLGPSATSRDISRIADEELRSALKDMRGQEQILYRELALDSPASFSNGRSALSAVDAEGSVLVPDDVPPWVRTALSTERNITLNDLNKVRGKILESARQAREAGNYDEARKLNLIANGDERVIDGVTVKRKGILDDLEAVDAEGIKNATSFSRQLNETFNQGTVAQILDSSARMGAGNAAPDVLNKVFSGTTQATNAAEFLKASPQSRPQLENFLRSRFIEKTSVNGKFDVNKSMKEISTMERDGLFEVFPEMKAELDNVSNLFARSERLTARSAEVTERGGSRMGRNDRDSLAKFILGAEPREEMGRLLSAEKPAEMAAQLRRRMGGNEQAELGLKTAYMETLWKSALKPDANGEPVVVGANLMKAFNKNVPTARALGMSEADITRSRTAIKQIMQMQKQVSGKETKLLTDPLSRVVKFIVTTVGANVGGMFGVETGAPLKTAATGSAMAGEITQEVFKTRPEKLLIDTIFDPDLMKAMLVKDTAALPERTRAGQIVEAWIVGSGMILTKEENDKYKTRQGSENAGVMESLNLGNQ